MNLQKLNPWNWFKHEENSVRSGGVPVVRDASSKRGNDPYFPADFHPVLRLQREIDRLFDSAFAGFGFPSTPRLFDTARNHEQWLWPNVDVAGDANKYEIKLDLPGLSENDISVEVRGDTLVVKGEKQESLEDNKDKKFYRVERRYGSFQRTLSLPDDAAVDDISATLKNGVLTLEIPRRETKGQADVKRIAIRN
jgi:Molecular chaperone (small heat shock protein)